MSGHSARKFTALRLIALCLLFICNYAYAATASRPGGSGMTWMRTADTLSNGDMVIYDQIGIDSYVILNSNLNDFDTFNNLGINYGLFDPLEIGIQASYLANDQHKTSGIRSYKAIIKLNVLGNKETDNYAVSISAFKTNSPADPAEKLGSGEIEDGAEINTSYYGDDVNIHLTLGSATADSKYYNPDVVYYSVEKQYANLGVEFKVSDKYTFGIEAIQEQSEDVNFDKNQIFAFSLQYKSTGNWDFDFGAAFGVPEDRSEPGKSFYFGFNYRIDGDTSSSSSNNKARTVQQTIPTPRSKPASRPRFSQKPKQVQQKKTKKKVAKADYKYRVSIKNATGSTASAKRVATFLKNNGYRVVSVTSITRRSKTEIRYLKRNSKQALQLAIKLPGNQDLRAMNKLEKNIDFEVVIGSDMVRSIR